MYKFVIVTDSDRASGFRLAGVEVLEAGSPEEAKKVISPLFVQRRYRNRRSKRGVHAHPR